MYCSKCGMENTSDSNYCYSCGNSLKINDNNNQNKNVKSGNEETSLVLGIICLVSSFFLNIICFIPGIISIIYAKKYKKESGKLGVGFGLSLGGMIFSVVVLILTIILFIFVLSVAGDVVNNIEPNITTEFTQGLPNV